MVDFFVRLERAYDKNKILELYLNRIPYGNNAWRGDGFKMYFGKSAQHLTLEKVRFWRLCQRSDFIHRTVQTHTPS